MMQEKQGHEKNMTFSKKTTPTNLIIREGDPSEKLGEPCVAGTRKHVARRGQLLEKFSTPTSSS